MWEIVRQNKIKSAFLICAMGLLLLFLGASFGVFFSRGRSGIVLGISFAGVIWFFLTFIAFVEGKNILLAFSGAKEVKHKDAPQLYNIVEEMKIAAALPSTPKVYIIDTLYFRSEVFLHTVFRSRCHKNCRFGPSWFPRCKYCFLYTYPHLPEALPYR